SVQCSLHSFCRLRALPSFPTRRSSDLGGYQAGAVAPRQPHLLAGGVEGDGQSGQHAVLRAEGAAGGVDQEEFGLGVDEGVRGARSEEHTSELQSRFDLVCRLVLEKNNVIQIVLWEKAAFRLDGVLVRNTSYWSRTQ